MTDMASPATPEPSILEPSTPEPSTPEPSTPEPSIPEPSIPKPSTSPTVLVTSRHSKKEHYLLNHTLASYLKSLEGKYIIANLIKNCTISGKLNHLDGFMNMEMEDVVFYARSGDGKPFDRMFIQGHNVVSVHLPAKGDFLEGVQRQLGELNSYGKPKPRSKKTFKQKRAEAQQQMTLASLASTSKEDDS